MLYCSSFFYFFPQILCILEKKQIQWVDKCNIHRINRPLIQDLEWNVQCEMFAILYSCTLRGRGNAREGAARWKQDPWVGRGDSWGSSGWQWLLFIRKASPVTESVRIMQCVARIMCRMCIKSLSIQDFWAMLETLCMSSMHVSVFWYVSADYVLCYISELMIVSEGKIIFLVQSQVLILYCYLSYGNSFTSSCFFFLLLT